MTRDGRASASAEAPADPVISEMTGSSGSSLSSVASPDSEDLELSWQDDDGAGQWFGRAGPRSPSTSTPYTMTDEPCCPVPLLAGRARRHRDDRAER